MRRSCLAQKHTNPHLVIMKQPLFKHPITRALLTWVAFIPIAIINGIIREALYKPVVGELAAHQISTVIVAGTFILLAYFLLKHSIPMRPTNKLWLIGLLWVVLTITFEMVLGHYVLGNSWGRVFYDYNLAEGRVWGLLLLTLL